MTFSNRLYAEDGELFEFEAQVTECLPEPDGTWRVVLDRTAFFPGGGGQAPDEGWLAVGEKTMPLVGLGEKEDRIYHRLPEAIPVGTRVRGKVDSNIRWPRMQTHSGEHILSGTIHSLYGLDNVGFHMGHAGTTLDVSGEMTEAMIREAEEKANEVVFSDVPITVLYPDEEKRKAMTYRSKKELEGEIRLVSVENCDLCACCAPHLRSSGKIGLIKIINSMRNKGGTRLTILCGREALAYYNDMLSREKQLCAALSSPPEHLTESVQRLMTERDESQFRARQMLLDMLRGEAQTAEVRDGRILLFRPDLTMDDLRFWANEAANRAGLAVAVSGTENNYRFVMVSPRRDIRDYLSRAVQNLEGKGGGKGDMAMGSFLTEYEKIRSFYECPGLWNPEAEK